MKRFALIVGYLATALFSYSLALGSFTERYPAFNHLPIAVFGAVTGPISVFALPIALVTLPHIPFHWRLIPLTYAERCAHHQRLWPHLPVTECK